MSLVLYYAPWSSATTSLLAVEELGIPCEVAEAGKAETQKLLATLDAHLAGKTWMVGDTYTLVDAHLAGALAWIGGLGFDVKPLKNVGAWSARCQDRPALAKVMAG